MEQQFARHQRCLLMHEAKPNVPVMDPKNFTLPYGDLVFDKVRRWLLDEDANMRGQALNQLIELYVESRENCVHSLHYGLLPLLVLLIATDEEHELRERAATAAEILFHEPLAQHQLMQSEEAGAGLLKRLLGALGDPFEGVIVLVLRVIIACHGRHDGFATTTRLVELGSVPTLLSLVQQSPTTVVRAVACAALVPTFDVKEAHLIFDTANGMQVITQALRETSDEMFVAEAADVVSRAAEFAPGKRAAVACETLSVLLPHLPCANLSVRVAVAAALAQVTVLESARRQAGKMGMPAVVLALLADEVERDVLMHVARLIANLAELPSARAALKPARGRLEELSVCAGDDAAIVTAFATALELLSRS